MNGNERIYDSMTLVKQQSINHLMCSLPFIWMLQSYCHRWDVSMPFIGMLQSHTVIDVFIAIHRNATVSYCRSIHMNGNEHIKWLIDCCLTSRYNIIMIIISPMAIWMIFSLLRRFILSQIYVKVLSVIEERTNLRKSLVIDRGKDKST
jgi:hypothetical protein